MVVQANRRRYSVVRSFHVDLHLLLVFLAALDVLMADVLPLAATVVPVPELVHAGVVAHLEGEAGTENRCQHGVVPLEEGAVDLASERHLVDSAQSDIVGNWSWR